MRPTKHLEHDPEKLQTFRISARAIENKRSRGRLLRLPAAGRATASCADATLVVDQQLIDERRVRSPGRVGELVHAALEGVVEGERLAIRERQELHQDHAGDAARRVEPTNLSAC